MFFFCFPSSSRWFIFLPNIFGPFQIDVTRESSQKAPASRADGHRVDPGDFGEAERSPREPRRPMENHHAINGYSWVIINYDNFQ